MRQLEAPFAARTGSTARHVARSSRSIAGRLESERRAGLLAVTVRLRSPVRVVVDLLAASSGIEREAVERAEGIAIDGVGTVPVARAEELLALKVLSMTDKRPQDRIDATNLLAVNAGIDMAAVRDLLARITARGFHREQDLAAKLEGLLSRR